MRVGRIRTMLGAAFALGAVAVVGAAIVSSVSACGTGFDSVSKIQGVRILATKADKPYAKPGDTVTLTMLVADGRADKTRAMTVSWIPAVCTNPVDDLYYACFAAAAAAADGGSSEAGGFTLGGTSGPTDAGEGGAPTQTASSNPGALAQIISSVPKNTDLTPFLPHDLTYSFVMPTNIIDTHKPTPGAPEPYGLAILFNFACAGALELTQIDPNGGPQQVPLGCFDANGNPAGADNGVLGLVRIFSYAMTSNANPVINNLLQDGNPVDLMAGITLDHCTKSSRSDCTTVKLVPDVPESSWELNPDDKGENGQIQHEQLWADYFTTTGDLGDDARLLYDVSAGKAPKPEVEYMPPSSPGEGTLWVVVHDSRGGTEWVVVPMHIR